MHMRVASVFVFPWVLHNSAPHNSTHQAGSRRTCPPITRSQRMMHALTASAPSQTRCDPAHIFVVLLLSYHPSLHCCAAQPAQNCAIQAWWRRHTWWPQTACIESDTTASISGEQSQGGGAQREDDEQVTCSPTVIDPSFARTTVLGTISFFILQSFYAQSTRKIARGAGSVRKPGPFEASNRS